MAWRIVFHKEVLRADLPALDSSAKKQILKTIEKKLTLDPHGYGEPLRRELFGYWKLKVGAYRVLYKIIKETVIVYILKIGPRKDDDVYQSMLKRLKQVR